MNEDEVAAELVRPPDAAELERLPADHWAGLLVHLKAVLEDLGDEQVSPVVARLRGMPASRLAGGRRRRELCRVLADGGIVWEHLRPRLAGDPEVGPLLAQLAGEREAEGDDAATGGEGGDLRRLRERLRALREDRDGWRRRAEGAEARAAGLEDEVASLRATTEQLEATAEDLRQQLADAGDERRRAVERERRRGAAERAEIEEELTRLRREAETRREADRREDDARPPATVARPKPSRAEPEPRVVPGRPTRLPEGVSPATTEGAALLLNPGRLVLVDGYNVTRQHRDHLDLAAQRSWLVQLLGALAARRRVRPVVVFDGERASGGPSTAARDVEVRFTPEGITADDEIVLAVEATDEPVVVVTDDRELVTRVRASRADVLGTGPFLWAAG